MTGNKIYFKKETLPEDLQLIYDRYVDGYRKKAELVPARAEFLLGEAQMFTQLIDSMNKIYGMSAVVKHVEKTLGRFIDEKKLSAKDMETALELHELINKLKDIDPWS